MYANAERVTLPRLPRRSFCAEATARDAPCPEAAIPPRRRAARHLSRELLGAAPAASARVHVSCSGTCILERVQYICARSFVAPAGGGSFSPYGGAWKLSRPRLPLTLPGPAPRGSNRRSRNIRPSVRPSAHPSIASLIHPSVQACMRACIYPCNHQRVHACVPAGIRACVRSVVQAATQAGIPPTPRVPPALARGLTRSSVRPATRGGPVGDRRGGSPEGGNHSLRQLLQQSRAPPHPPKHTEALLRGAGVDGGPSGAARAMPPGAAAGR
eukprot:scaffold2360_cov380-Prasinococcus_capsulatus_cf.AAC.12